MAFPSVRLIKTTSIAGIGDPNDRLRYLRQSIAVIFSIVPRHLFSERTAHALKGSAFRLIPDAIGFEIGPQSWLTTSRFTTISPCPD